MVNKRKLNKGQIDYLKLLYTYRYGTRELIANGLGKTNNYAIYSRLTILEREGYLKRRYNKSYKLAGRPAEYFLLPEGLRLLQAGKYVEGLDEAILKQSYKDASASDGFIQKNLMIFSIANRLISLYGLKFLTRRELSSFEYLIRPLPDGFISYKKEGETRRFFVEFVSIDTPAFVIERRLGEYVKYENDGEWEQTGTAFPTILVILDNPQSLKRMPAVIKRVTNLTNLNIYYNSLTNITTNELPMWLNIEEEVEIYLNNIM